MSQMSQRKWKIHKNH